MNDYSSVSIINYDNIAVIEFSPGHRYNPFSSKRMNSLQNAITTLAGDPETQAIILYGGKERSFSVGGDFNEVSEFKGGEEVSKWIDSVNNLYTAILRFPKPTIAAIDGYAIGFGLQLALTCDYRLSSSRAEFRMPELAVGISCNFGGYMLEKFVSRSVMQSMIFKCTGVYADQAKDYGVIHEVCPPETLLDNSVMLANKFITYPSVPVEETKKTMNQEIIKGLEQICIQAKKAHKRSFASGDAQPKMKKIIGEQ